MTLINIINWYERNDLHSPWSVFVFIIYSIFQFYNTEISANVSFEASVQQITGGPFLLRSIALPLTKICTPPHTCIPAPGEVTTTRYLHQFTKTHSKFHQPQHLHSICTLDKSIRDLRLLDKWALVQYFSISSFIRTTMVVGHAT